MTDLEDQLTRELAGIADAEPGPHVDVAGVRRVGGRERRRRRGLVVGAVAAAVAVVAALSVALPRVGGDVEPAGRGAAPLRLAWWTPNGTVHLPGGRTVEVSDLSGVDSRGGTTLVASGPLGSQRWSLSSGPGADLAPVDISPQPFGSPVFSVGGDHLAWAVMRSAGSLEVFSLDVATGVRTRTVLSSARRKPVLGVTDVDDAGRVLLSRDSAPPLLWDGRADSTPFRVSGADELVLLPDGRAAAYASVAQDPTGRSVDLVDLAGNGAVGGRVAVPGPAYAFNTDGTAYLVPTRAGYALVSLDGDVATTGATLDLPAAEDDGWQLVGWEDRSDLVFSSGSRLVRCSVGTDACEAVPSIGDGRVGAVGGP